MKSLLYFVAVIVLALPAHALAQSADKPFSNEQLDQLTAQIALYPDSLLAQLLMATTYPEDFAAAAAWSKAHPDAKGDDAVKMVENEPWDPSVASLVAFPEVLITFGGQPDWVRNMGDAFLAQPDDVMNSVQRLRQKAQAAGNLKSNEQVKVSVQAAEPAPATQTVVVQQSAPPQVIVIEPAQPSVVFVPSFNPTVVYGPWPWVAYPPFFFPPPPGFWWSRPIATGIAWGVGIGVTNALWGGVRWGGGWGHNSVNINVNRYNNINVNRRLDVNNRTANWNHNPDRRGNTPYRGGDATRRNLENRRDAGNREQYRGRDASREASRERANQAMQNRGIDAGSGSARERAQSVDRSAMQNRAQNVDRSAVQNRAQNVDRSAVQNRAQNVDRSAAQNRAQNVDRSAAQNRAQNIDRSAARRTARRTWTATRRASVPSPRVGTTRCGAPTARRQAPRSIAAGRARRRRNVPAVVAARVRLPAAAGARPAAGGGGGVRCGAAAAAADGDVEMERTNMTNFKHILNVAAVAASLALAPSALAQNAYPTPEAAAEALVDGIARHDRDAIKAVVGSDYEKYFPSSKTDPEDVTNFLEAWARGHAIVPAGTDKAFLGVGKNGWTLPVPIVKTAAGWRFDTKGAPEEMRVRRIGRNELAAIQVALAYTDAQKEYRQTDWNGDGVLEYATRPLSSPGQARRPVLGVAARRAGEPAGCGVRRCEGWPAVPRVSVQDPHGAREERAGRGEELHQERPDDRRLCARRVAGEVRRHRRDDVHRQPGRRRVPEEPRAEH